MKQIVKAMVASARFLGARVIVGDDANLLGVSPMIGHPPPWPHPCVRGNHLRVIPTHLDRGLTPNAGRDRFVTGFERGLTPV